MNINLMNGDCLELMKDIPDNSIDMILTDPPYTMTKRGKSCRPNWMPNNMGNSVFKSEIPNSDEWMQLCYNKLKYSTHFYTFCNTNDISMYLNSAKLCGFKLHNIITVIKDTHMPNRWYIKNCELILFFRKGDAKPINDMTSRDYYKVNMPKLSSGKLHITQKPLDLIEKLIINSTKENDIVLDLFMGSATTGVACLNTNRNFIGMELDNNYYKIATDRVNNHRLEKESGIF